MVRLGTAIMSIVRHPIGAGLVAVVAIAVGILLAGGGLLQRDFVRDAHGRQAADLARLNQMLHYSELGLGQPSARAELQQVASSPMFAETVERALFGMDVLRLDIYSLDGALLYTTDPLTAQVDVSDSRQLEAARRGVETSELRTTALGGNTAHALTTFGLIEDAPPDIGLGGRPLAVLAITRDVQRELGAVRSTARWIASVFLSGLALILLTVYWVSEKTRARFEAANETLRIQNASVRESRERMVRAGELAKRAIAEELHGSVQTKLYAVWMKLTTIRSAMDSDKDQAAEDLDRVIEELDMIREEDIRQLSHRLHPSIVRMGAAPGLRSLRDFYEDLFPIDLQITDAVAELETAGQSEIPDNIRVGVYRIAELALGNVAKHARPSLCEMRWDYDTSEGLLRMDVSDDGAGFDPETQGSEGLGLVTIHDYADAMGGTFSIKSSPGGGTSVTVSIPFERPAQSRNGRSTNSHSAGGVEGARASIAG